MSNILIYKHTDISYFKGLFLDSFRFIKKHWQLLIITLLFSSLAPLRQVFKIPASLTFLVSLFSLGWTGAQVEFIREALISEHISWRKLPTYTFTYIKKLLPFVLQIAFLLIILFIVFIFSSRQISSSIKSLPFTNEGGHVLYQLFLISLELIGSYLTLLVSISIIFVVLKREKIRHSIKIASVYLQNHKQFALLLFAYHVVTEVVYYQLIWTNLLNKLLSSIIATVFICSFSLLGLVVSVKYVLDHETLE